MGETVKNKYEIVPPSSSKYEIEPPSNPNAAMLATAKKNLATPRGGAQGVPEISATPQLHWSDLAALTHPGQSSPAVRQLIYNIADKATNALPAIGGIGGGMAGVEGGPPGMVAGAAIGGAGGESLRQLARRAIFPPSKGYTDASPQNSLDAASQIGTEGIKQGAYELGGQGLRLAGKAIAPKLAEAAVAPGKQMMKALPEGVDIGKTLLNETTGVRPKTIVGQLDSKIAGHNAAEDAALVAAKNTGTKIPIAPTRKMTSDELAAATEKNSPSYLKDVQSVNDQLTHQFGPDGKKIGSLPDFVDPVRARALRQGIDTEIGSWSTGQDAIKPLQKRVYGSLTGAIHSAVPDSIPHDAAMTNLIPTREAAWNTSFAPGITKSVAEKLTRSTGALVGAGIGGEEGYKHGGVPGMVAGGLTGLVLPNAVASPTGLMVGARALNSGILPGALRYAVPIGEGQITKPSASKNKRPGDTEDEE